jgi:hypothetical protein
MESVDLILFSAFEAPKDDIFFKNQQSDDWKRLKNYLQVVPISDYKKYESKYNTFITLLTTAGASVFKGLEDDNILV